MKPVEVKAPELIDFILGGKSILPEGEKKAKLVLIPIPKIFPLNIQVARSKIVLEDIRFRTVRQDGSFFCISSEDRNLPLFLEICMDSETGKGSYKIQYDYDNSTPLQTIKFEEFLSTLNKERELLLVDPSSGRVIGGFHL